MYQYMENYLTKHLIFACTIETNVFQIDFLMFFNFGYNKMSLVTIFLSKIFVGENIKSLNQSKVMIFLPIVCSNSL